MKKICKICKEEKDVNDFYKNNNKCKSCKISYQKKYTESNSLKVKKYKNEYRLENLEKLKIKNIEFYEKNKEIIKERSKIYYENNRDKKLGYQKEYQSNNKDKRNKREQFRNRTDLVYRLRKIISKLTHQILKRGGYTKSKSSIEIIGCYPEFLIEYIESKFEFWMNWDNYGLYNGEFNYGWDLDHIIPLSSAKSEEEVYKLSNYSNLQPLDSVINRNIKRDRIDFYINNK